MTIDKDRVVELLTAKGQHDEAAATRSELPDQVDPERDRGLLDELGVDPTGLIAQPGGGGLGRMLVAELHVVHRAVAVGTGLVRGLRYALRAWTARRIAARATFGD